MNSACGTQIYCFFFFFAFSVFVGPVNNARDTGKTQTTAVARMTLSKLTLNIGY